jgi:hypothetical protein
MAEMAEMKLGQASTLSNTTDKVIIAINAPVAQWRERQPSKLKVMGSSPVRGA